MKFVILSSVPIPGFNGQRGPLLTPQYLDAKLVLKMVAMGIDVKEVMEDGSYRDVEFSDSRLIDEMANANKIKSVKEEAEEKKVIEEVKEPEKKEYNNKFNNYKDNKKKFNKKNEDKIEVKEEVDDLKENL